MKLELRIALAATSAFAVGLVAGCSVDPTHYEDQQYACTSDGDCVTGNVCVGGTCQAAGSGGGMGTGGGGSTGGGVGGGVGGGITGGGSGGGGDVDAGCGANPEVCGDLVDDNCNGILDDGCPCTGVGVPCYPLGLASPTLRYAYDGGAGCAAGLQSCVGGALAVACENAHVPQLEFCDGQDTDCDGLPDPLTLCPCQAGRSCYQGSPFTVSTGVCRPGTWNCTMPAGQQCVGQVLPAVREQCNGLDDDCNGQVDELAETSPCGPGVCASANRACVDGGQPACDYTASPPPGYAASEICGDGLDNNCDGFAENGCICVVGSAVACWTGSSAACPTDGGMCLGVCRRGMQACATQTDGGTGYNACNGQTAAGTESCTNSLDDDCDGVQDCADSDCASRACGANGFTCSGGACRCLIPDGGLGQAAETICNDAIDNDCDGLLDCAETACGGLSCGTFGRTCVGTACSCVVIDGGVAQTAETICNDGRDNDCDGLVDCAESACTALGCGANGRTCTSGSCTCSGNGGTAQANETLCSDGKDNDCDGLVDCADPGCSASSCGANGLSCSGVSCVCSGNGGTAEAMESTCNDAHDNDCDGLTDCADTTCAGQTCGANGRSCSGTTCACSGNGGTAQATETTCNDAHDNDCDGATDCADSNCAGQVCGSNGLKCSGAMCACSGNGGTAQATESSCSDGFDNDCDGLVDCLDPNCATATCGANGLKCSGTTCACSGNGGVAQATETTCNDTFDNDCDGKVDCADPNCATAANCLTPEICNDGIDNDGNTLIDCADSACVHKVCGGTSASICCGTTCTSLTTATNCGQCGLACPSGACTAVGTGSHQSGQCTCPTGVSTQCPQPAGYNRQSCNSGNLCTCGGNDDQCGNAGVGQGSRCISATPLDYCHYQ